MPALDIHMIESLSRELHPPHTNLMAETEVSVSVCHFSDQELLRQLVLYGMKNQLRA